MIRKLLEWPEPMERWPLLQVNIIAGLFGGFAFMVASAFLAGPLNPTRDFLLFGGLEFAVLLLANSVALWRNLTIERAERRFKEHWSARASHTRS